MEQFNPGDHVRHKQHNWHGVVIAVTDRVWINWETTNKPRSAYVYPGVAADYIEHANARAEGEA